MKFLNRVTACLCWVLAGTAQAQTINLEIDYMFDTDHTHQPQAAEVNALIQMFACQGWTLNVSVSDGLSHVDVMRCDDLNDDFFACTDPNSFKTLKDQFFDHAGGGWHYCIFGHNYDNGSGSTDSSGLAEIGEDDLVVTLGSFFNSGSKPVGTPFDRAATLAHELGHNLGLHHWPPALFLFSEDSSPIYASIMSYQYQLSGVRSRLGCLGLTDATSLFKDIDYSHGRLPFVVESALNEPVGLGIHNVDWDCDGVLDTDPVLQDLDEARPWCGATGTSSILTDYDDWANIDSTADSPGPDRLFNYEPCLSAREHYASNTEHLLVPGGCPTGQPTLTLEACVPGEMIWVDPSAVGGGTGAGSNPYNDIFVAYLLAPDHSVLYLQAGTLTNGGVPITMDRPITLAGVGVAVIDP